MKSDRMMMMMMMMMMMSILLISVDSSVVTVSNTKLRLTRLGNVVGAQDGNIVNTLWNGEYALVGMEYGQCTFTSCQNQSLGSCGFGSGKVSVWTSPNLSDGTWSEPFEILPAVKRPSNAIYFRPHVAWNPLTKMFVLWIRWLPIIGQRLGDDPTLYLSAVSVSLTGPFSIVHLNVSMFYPDSADDNLFVDEDGTAYLVHTARSTDTKIVVERLSKDMTYPTGERSEQIGPGHTEAPAMFRRYDTYYVTMSHLCCYCVQGTETLVYRSTHPLGPYVPDGTLGNAPRAQQNFVFPWVANDSSALGSGNVLWSGNRWGSDPSQDPPSFDNSLQYWTMLKFRSENESIQEITWEDSIEIESAVLRG